MPAARRRARENANADIHYRRDNLLSGPLDVSRHNA
jgi:hypothetical protein